MTKWNSRSAVFALAAGLIFAFVLSVAVGRIEAAPRPPSSSAQAMASGVSVGADDIGGVVTSANGPEAGVWVIAETGEFQTKYRKIVVTDDQGRYLIPSMPKAKYKVWVRGYGLVDSTPVEATIGQNVALKAIVAPDTRTAAQIYPPNYWLSMLNIPAKDQFPMKIAGDKQVATQGDWIDLIKTGCQTCHQMGDKITREMPMNLGTFPTTKAAWERRILSSQVGGNMVARLNAFGHDRAIDMFADWTDRITAGEVPPVPPRPSGLERNVVLTLWDVAGPKTFLHSEVSTNRWNPRVNPNGPVYNGDWSGGDLVAVDPLENTASMIPIPLPHEEDRKNMPTWSPKTLTATSPYWGDEVIWDDPINPKNAQIDRAGRVWVSVENRPPQAPDFCKASSGNIYAQAWESGQISRPDSNASAFRYQDTLQKTGIRMPWESPPGWGLAVYDPKTRKFESIDLCFGQSHAVFADDKDETLYFSLRTGGLAWFKTAVWNKTHDAAKSQGWCAPVIDFNGDGKTGPYTVVGTPADPKYDRLPIEDGYGMGMNPVDGSVWYTAPGPMPGRIVRAIPGPNPPSTCATEVYEPPFHNPKFNNEMHYTPRGIDVDSNGLVWTALAGSGDLATFDRKKCKVLNGPTATGQHCPEGWTIYSIPGPGFKGTEAKADWYYVNWVDRLNTFGLGTNVQVVLGTGSDSLKLYKPDTKEWVVIQVPYPMGFYTRDIDGRIDDPKTGWRGRGLWASTETRVIWHAEGGKGQTPQMAHFQIRPDPLAK